MDARDGIEPSIVLLQRTVLPFDHPAIVVTFTTALIISHLSPVSRGKIIFFRG